MAMDFKNYYMPGTQTSVPNSGTGNGVLTKPAGTETATIMHNRKYCVYVPSEMVFDFDFQEGVDEYTIGFYTKPNVGQVASFAGNIVTYDGKSYTLSNDSGGVSVPVSSHRASLLIFTVSDFEIAIHVNGERRVIDNNTAGQDTSSKITLLSAGGIVGDIFAHPAVLSSSDISNMVLTYLTPSENSIEIMLMTDDNREMVQRSILNHPAELAPRTVYDFEIPSSDALSSKIEYRVLGNASVLVNGNDVSSGYWEAGPIDTVSVATETGCTIYEVILTEYFSSDVVSAPNADFSIGAPTGNFTPTHTQDDQSLTRGVLTVIPKITSGNVSGWFQVRNGTVLPDVTMNDGVLTGSNLYVNGKPYSGGTLYGWYFLSASMTLPTQFLIDVPVHMLSIFEGSLTASDQDDIYEGSFMNPILNLPPDNITLTEQPALVISTEWSIVSSG